jgi:hypothetical protein
LSSETIEKVEKSNALDNSIYLGNIESLTSEANAYKKTCLELDTRISELVTLLEKEKRISDSRIKDLESKLQNTLCEGCSISASHRSQEHANHPANHLETIKQAGHVFVGGNVSDASVLKDNFESPPRVITSTMICEKMPDSAFNEASVLSSTSHVSILKEIIASDNVTVRLHFRLNLGCS